MFTSGWDVRLLQLANDTLHNSAEFTANEVGDIAEHGSMIVRLTAELQVAVAGLRRWRFLRVVWRCRIGSQSRH